jgi:hypothetical protein
VFVEELVQRVGAHGGFGGEHFGSGCRRRHPKHHPSLGLQLVNRRSEGRGLAGAGGSNDQLQRR